MTRLRTSNHDLRPLPAGSIPGQPTCSTPNCLRIARHVARYTSRRGDKTFYIKQALCTKCAEEFAGQHLLMLPCLSDQPCHPGQLSLAQS
ncbi:MAG: hypothetical protein ACM359_02630 [Bacillota bacterium]